VLCKEYRQRYRLGWTARIRSEEIILSNEPVDSTRANSICVGIDGSPDEAGAVRWAVRLAQLQHSHIHLVHALPSVEWVFGDTVFAARQGLDSELHHVGQGYLDKAVRLVHELDPDIEVQSSISDASSVELMKSLSANANMMVLTSVESGPLRDFAFGYSIVEMVNAAQCPVLAWRPRTDENMSESLPIVVGVDGSEPSRRALAAAFELADTLSAALIAVHVGAVREKDELDYGGAVDWQHLRQAERTWLQKIVDPLREKYPSVQATTQSSGSTVARELRALSAAAQVIVVGSRGRGRLSGAILGSVSQNLIHHAECPVLVVH
jgi:nucleotide-binding universal stress UspA family protein